MAFEGGSSLARRRAKDQARARDMKARGEERRSGRCCVCYGVIPNDTIDGDGARQHYERHSRGFRGKKE